ncbi:NAD-dependent epimerase [Aquibium microcysteis]|uniref:NAD-dependent epimerase n=1 Tax=Aquibium microcysteis TaxID=675281 RepID=UPI0023B22935|nr:NAD-dependent epimerase [Aquibium microcysteis]
MRILVTGAAGFIGYHVAKALLEAGHAVTGFDDVNPYYDPKLKRDRLALLAPYPGFRMVEGGLEDRAAMETLFSEGRFERVVHLAAQAGVRHSIANPHAYAGSNLVGFLHVLEGCRHTGVGHLVYASSSSVYGANRKLPFSEHDNVDHPVSLYAATKKANELMAHSYAHLYRLPVTGLRFFTVYGPWGRPDMAPIKFARAILAGEPIDVYNGGNLSRDFTYVDDVVDGVVRALGHVPAAPDGPVAPDPATSPTAPYRVFNIGNSAPVPLMDFIAAIEAATGRTAKLNMLPMQPGDVANTFADVGDLAAATGFAPKVSVDEGIRRFVAWYRGYYGA